MTRSLYETLGTVFRVNADGSDFRAIGEGHGAAWSPDGSRIAVYRYASFYRKGDDVVLFTTAPDGADVRVLVRRDQDDRLVTDDKT